LEQVDSTMRNAALVMSLLMLALATPAAAYTANCHAQGNKWICQISGYAGCDKAGFFPPSPPQTADEDFWYPIQSGFQFVLGTGRATITTSRNDGRVHITGLTTTRIKCDWYCHASLTDDAFVYGYCSAEAKKLPPAASFIHKR
jgi:hypothetical protein